jgi:GH24 family phage-related lysozyme (muramidase)
MKINQNNWYHDAQNSSELIQEAGLKNWKILISAVALVISGMSLLNVSEKTGLTQEQIQEALANDKIMQEAHEMTTLPVPNNVVKPTSPTQPNPTSLDFSGIENLIRLHEVSGAKRNVTVNGKEIDIRKVYPDPIYGMKIPTIGVGYNLNRSEAKSEIESLGLDYQKIRNGSQMLTDDQVNLLYRNDIAKSIANARKTLSNFDQQPTQVKTIVVDMIYNMGETRLRKFKKFLQALTVFDFSTAADEMKDSKWYNQVGERSRRLESMMRSLAPNQNAPQPIPETIPEPENIN